MNTRVSVLLINVASTSFKVISPVSGSSDQTKSPTSISSISTNPSSVKTNVSSVKQFPKHNFLFLLSLTMKQYVSAWEMVFSMQLYSLFSLDFH